MIWIGIDPGVTGALCRLRDGRVSFVDMPVNSIERNGKNRTEYDPHELACVLRAELHTARGDGREIRVVIERQQAMPASVQGGRTQGVTSTFATGYGFGVLIGVIAAVGLPYHVVAPVSWKSKMLGGRGKAKGDSILRAKQLFPSAANDLRLKKHHNRAEALLLAAYGHQFLQTAKDQAP